MEDKKALTQNIFEIENISKSYQQEKTVHALVDISFFIEKGDVFGIIGESGAGKSTLIRSLCLLATPSSGRILFQGKDISKMKKVELREYRKNIGMIFQHFNLLSSQTVAGNISYPLEIAGVSKEEQNKRVDDLLRLIGLTDKKEAYPSQLSGGQKQRVGIARALANHPDVLLCDEITSALDPKSTREILDLLKDINQKLNVTIILITHEMEVVKQICNKVAVIEKGRIVEKGSVADVFADPKQTSTKQFLQRTVHEIPTEFFKVPSANRKLLRLKFKGKVASDPIISDIVRKFNVDANILLGWVDQLQTMTIGTLIIELTGSPEGIESGLNYLSKKDVHYEVIENES